MGVISDDRAKFPYLDLLRGVAAFLVLIGHIRAMTHVPFGGFKDSGWMANGFYLLTGFGHQAVIIFFVLSGFLIGRSVILRQMTGQWSWSNYLIDRLSRLWIVLVPCLIFTLFLDTVGRQFDKQGFYAGVRVAELYLGPRESGISLEPSTFLANVAFLQPVYFPVYGSNGPLWSLAYEFWYYLLFPLIGIVITGRSNRWIALLCVLAFGWIAGAEALSYGAIWLFGVGAFLLTQCKKLKPFFARAEITGVAIGLLLVALVLTRLWIVDGLGGDYLVGAGTATTVAVLAENRNIPVFVSRQSRILASFSFSLYLAHFPIVALLVVMFLDGERYHFGVAGMSAFLMIATVAIATSWLFYLAFERHTSRIRSWLRRRFSRNYSIESRA